jgi:hypothetical protein
VPGQSRASWLKRGLRSGAGALPLTAGSSQPSGAARPRKSRSKFFNKRCETTDGIKFASKAERRRYFELKQLEKLGDITDLELQPVLPIEVNGETIGKCVPDFSFVDRRTGERIWEDVKGGVEGKATTTQLTRWQHRLVHAIFGITIRIVPR